MKRGFILGELSFLRGQDQVFTDHLKAFEVSMVQLPKLQLSKVRLRQGGVLA